MTKSQNNGKSTLSCTKRFTVLCPSPTKVTLTPICQESQQTPDSLPCPCDGDQCPLDDKCTGKDCNDNHKCPYCDPCNKFMCDYFIISDRSMMYNLVFDQLYDPHLKKYVWKTTATSTPLTSGCETNHLIHGYTWKAIVQPVCLYSRIFQLHAIQTQIQIGMLHQHTLPLT